MLTARHSSAATSRFVRPATTSVRARSNGISRRSLAASAASTAAPAASRSPLATATKARARAPVRTGPATVGYGRADLRRRCVAPCVDLIADLVGQSGLGRLAPFWAGPIDNDVLAQSPTVADPDGGTSEDDLVTQFSGLIGESPA